MSEKGKIYAGRYRIDEEVGRGGMAVVYRGLDQRMKRTVAIKVLYPYLAIKRENKVRFQREAEVVANLDHRNVVRIYDYSGIDSDENFIVTEFIEGDTLKRFVTDHPIRVPEVGAMMVRDIAAALGHAHDREIIHRDVKPENVMINQHGVLKLMDFGIAQIKDVQQMTVTGTMIGSPAHMSPEHIEGRALDPRADIFSLGTVLYLLCVGKLPFSGTTAHALLKQILDVRYVPAVQANPAVGTELSLVIDRCLRREPDERYQSCAELRLALEYYLDQMGFENIGAELSAFFTGPDKYQEVACQRLVERLVKDARAASGEGKLARALRLFDRALTLDPSRDDIVDEIERVQRQGAVRRFLARYVAPLVALGIIGTCGWVLVDQGTFWGSSRGLQSETKVEADVVVAPAAEVVSADATGWDSTRLTDVVDGALDAIDTEDGSPGRATADVLVVAPEVLGRARQALRQVSTLSRSAGRAVRVAPEGISRVRDWAAARAAAGKTSEGKGAEKEGNSGTSEKGNGGSKVDHGGPKGPQGVVREIPVTVVGNPSAVEIWVDGTMRGHGRLNDLPLTVGEHQVRLHHPSCLQACEDKIWSLEVTGDRDRLEVRESIAFKPAMLQVVSEQRGVVFVNTEPMGRTNEIIRLRAKDQQPWQVDVAVLFEDDVSPPLKRTVEVAPGRLRKVRSD